KANSVDSPSLNCRLAVMAPSDPPGPLPESSLEQEIEHSRKTPQSRTPSDLKIELKGIFTIYILLFDNRKVHFIHYKIPGFGPCHIQFPGIGKQKACILGRFAEQIHFDLYFIFQPLPFL